MALSIEKPELLLITDRLRSQSAFGCDQTWYASAWQRQAGCGPCTAATILFYLARSRAFLDHLYTPGSQIKEDFQHFMNDIWQYVTPGTLGVNEASILADGVVDYARDHGIQLTAHVMTVPRRKIRHEGYPVFDRFIREGLRQDCPVAFLNLSNGGLKNLDSWHWVTITELSGSDSSVGQATISDSGYRKVIDLSAWYDASRWGGGAVWFDVASVSQSGSGSLPAANSDRG